MKGFGAAAVCAALLFPAFDAQAADGIAVTHFEPLQRLSVEKSRPTAATKLEHPGTVAVGFDALGRAFELQLEPNDRLLAGNARRALTGDAQAFRGRLAGSPGSWVRIVLADGMPRGIIVDGGHVYAIEAPGDSAVTAASAVIYRLADVVIEPGTLRCGASMSGSAARMFGNVVGELETAMAQAPGATRQIDIGAIGDFEFFDGNGGTSEAAILTRLNIVDGIYSEQLGVQIHVEELEVFADPSDPFSDTTVPGDLLDELVSYRRNTQAQSSQGLTHLYTGRDLDTNTVGIAFTNVLCHPSHGAGLTQAGGNPTFDSLVAAHEIGHNFGAPHDGESGSACESETGEFIMAPTLNGSDEFSQCSILQMQPNIDSASCIVPLPSSDMSLVLDGSLDPVLLGNSATVRFTATNVGTETAENVAVSVALPTLVSLDSATVSQGSCSSGAGQVDCSIGTVPGGSDATVTVNVTAVDTGTDAFTAAVTSDTDDFAGNDTSTAELTVDPAVNLVVNAIAGRQVDVNGSTSVSVALDNLAVLDASGVELSVSLTGGLRANAASWTLGDCTVGAQQVDCQAGSFPSQSGATLNLDLTATTAGQSTYEVSLTSAEAEAQPGDNSATGSVTATEPAATASDGSGGGGASAWLSLLFLGALVLRRLRIDSRHLGRSNTPLASGMP